MILTSKHLMLPYAARAMNTVSVLTFTRQELEYNDVADVRAKAVATCAWGSVQL